MLWQLFAQGLLQGVGFVRGGCRRPKSTLQMLWGCRCEPHHQNPSTFGLNMSGFGLKEQARLCASSSGAGAGAVGSGFLGHFCTIPESPQGCRVVGAESRFPIIGLIFPIIGISQGGRSAGKQHLLGPRALLLVLRPGLEVLLCPFLTPSCSIPHT